MSFALEMTMAPKVGLEVSPALVAFGELLILPCAAMQSVIERELRANPALERLDAGECPICRGSWRTRCPVCSVPARRSGRASRCRRGRRPGGGRAGRPGAAARGADGDQRRRRPDRRVPDRQPRRARPSRPVVRGDRRRAGRRRIGRGVRARRHPPLRAARSRRDQRRRVPAAPARRARPRRRPRAARPRRHRRSPAGAGAGPLHLDRARRSGCHAPRSSRSSTSSGGACGRTRRSTATRRRSPTTSCPTWS